MKKLTLHDIRSLFNYQQEREEFRREVIEITRKRRVHLGELVSLVFENRDTVRFQVQEMMRTERMTDKDAIQEELDIFNPLIPDRGDLSATMFIEIADPQRVEEELNRLFGIEDSVYLQIGDEYTVKGQPEPGRTTQEKISAVQYVKFRLTPEEMEAFSRGDKDIYILINHPNYQARARLSPETRRALDEDLLAA